MKSIMMRIVSFSLLLVLFITTPTGALQSNPISAASILIRGGMVIDGSGAPARRADVRIIGDKIAEIGQLKPRADERIIEAKGLTVAPGFIDIHNHSERGLSEDPTARSQVLQGITTLAVGPDGSSPFPIAKYLATREEKHAAVNLLAFIGHATARQQVMGKDYNRVATPDEISRMRALVEQAMQEGAWGLSSGLEYDVGHPSTTEEVIEMAKAAARHHGIYMSHIRDESDDMLVALREAIRIGREAHLPVQISHIKMGTVGVWDKSPEAIKTIVAARKSGVDVTADCYPYDAWASTITVLVPSRRHDDAKAVAKGLEDVGGAANVMITNCGAHRDYQGKTLEEIARAQNRSPVDVYIEVVKDGGASVVCRSMKESDIENFYKQPWVMVASDGGIGMPHPRGAGTYPRVLGRFVREKRWLRLEDAIRKMTSLPATRLGIKDRGILRAGMKADIVLFDAATVIDHSTMTSPFVEPTGIAYVFVNGVVVVEDSKVTGALPGAVLKHQTKGNSNEKLPQRH